MTATVGSHDTTSAFVRHPPQIFGHADWKRDSSSTPHQWRLLACLQLPGCHGGLHHSLRRRGCLYRRSAVGDRALRARLPDDLRLDLLKGGVYGGVAVYCQVSARVLPVSGCEPVAHISGFSVASKNNIASLSLI